MTGDGAERGRADRATDLILARGLIGLVWLDADLVVRRRLGALTDWVELGASYIATLPQLVGHEEPLAQLRLHPERCEVLPNVGLKVGPGKPPKLDAQIFWLPLEMEYLVVLGQNSLQVAFETELRRETALRQLAERREVELARAIERTNAELRRTNRDLEEFAYVISHDLRAPLRAMRITSDLLERELGTAVSPEAQENLRRIRLLSRRMGAMMSGLLEYSRVGRKHEAVASVDTGRLLDDIMAGIGAPASLAIERSGKWPVFETLAEPLDVVLRNLIENAVKHHDTRRGVIALSAADDGAFLRIDIADDGPGIDPTYHTAIFEPFRTISDESSPDSSGIGLALVKKTVELVGGRIEVASEPAVRRGTTFRVFWPRRIRHD